MPDTKISALVADTTLHVDDLLVVVDTHDVSMASTGTDKKLTPAQLFGSLTGDITYSGFGGSITPGAITVDKLASMPAASLLGNPGVSTAAPGTITLGANLSFSGTTLVAATGGAANPGGTANQLQYNSGGTAFAGFTMSGDATLVPSTGVITIAAGAITQAKMANVTAARLLGNPTGSAAAPGEISLGTNLSFTGSVLNAAGGGGGSGTVNSGTIGQVAYYAAAGTTVSSIPLSGLVDSAISATQGVILYRGAAVWSALAPGTSGQFLQTQGAAANPVWATGAGGGSGTVNSGTAGQLTYYAATGTAVSGQAIVKLGAQGQLNLAEQAAPTTLVAGDRWNDSTQHCTALFDGSATSANCLPLYRAGLLYAQIAPGSVTTTGTNVNQSLINTAGAIGTVNLPAGFLNVKGRKLRVSAGGWYTSSGGAGGAIYLYVKFGTTFAVSSQVGTPGGTETNYAWRWFADIAVKSTGVSGTIVAQGVFDMPNTGGNTIQFGVSTSANTGVLQPQTPLVLDLTQAYLFDFLINMAGTNVITMTDMTIEVIG